MTDSSTFGYSRTVMLKKPCRPRSRIRMAMTIVRTGRRMKSSEKFTVCRSPSRGRAAAGSTSLLMVTRALLESLFWPEVTTVWPGCRPESMRTRSPRAHRPTTKTCFATSFGRCLPAAASPAGSCCAAPSRSRLLPAAAGVARLRFHDEDVVAIERCHDRRLRQSDDVLDRPAARHGCVRTVRGAVRRSDSSPPRAPKRAASRIDLRVDADDATVIGEVRPR